MHHVDQDAQERRLREFGLSEYASRAYLALLKLGITEARPVSRLARVPIAKVYSTLDQLAQRGLCTIEPGPPKRFAPVPIERFVEQVASEHEAQARQLLSAKDELKGLFPIEPGTHTDDRGLFQVLRGRRATLERLRQLYDGAKQGILLQATDNLLGRHGLLTELSRRAHDRGIDQLALARVDATTAEDLAEGTPFVHVRAKEGPADHVAMCIVDRKTALVIHFLPPDTNQTRGEDVALFTTEEAIVGSFATSIERAWNNAAPLDVQGKALKVRHDGR